MAVSIAPMETGKGEHLLKRNENLLINNRLRELDIKGLENVDVKKQHAYATILT